MKRKSMIIWQMKGIGNSQFYYGVFQNKVPLKRIRKERIRKETKERVSHLIAIVI